MADRDIEFRLKARSQFPAGLEEAKTETKAAASEMAQSMGGIVPEKATQGMESLTAHTNRLSSMMRLVGGDIGGAAAEVTNYGGRIVGMLTHCAAWEIALVGIAAGIGAVVYALTRADEWTESWNATLEKNKKAVDEVKEAVDQMVASARLQVAGIEGTEVAVNKAREQLVYLSAMLKATRVEMAQWEREHMGHWSTGKKGDEWQELLGKEAAFLADMKRVQTEYDRAFDADAQAKSHEMDKRVDDENRREEEKEKRHQEKVLADARKFEQERLDMAAEYQRWRAAWQQSWDDAEYQAWIEQDRRENEQQKKNEEKVLQVTEEVTREIVAAERKKTRDIEQLWKQEDRALVALEKSRRENINNAIDLAEQGLDVGYKMAELFGAFAVSAKASEEEKAKAAAKAMAWQSGIQAAFEWARSIQSFANLDPWGGTQHALAATLFTAAAAKAMGDMSGGGGGGTAGGGTTAGRARFEEATRGNESEAEEKARSTVVINVYGHQVIGRDADRMFAESVESWTHQQNPGRDERSF
jgi:hypothetical protein